MPHSSGGCSHGGGSHGGSHGGHGGHSSGSSRRISNHHFAGARTFVYFRNSRPVYVYSNYDLKKGSSCWENLVPVFLMFPFIAIMIFFIVLELIPPSKLEDKPSYVVSIEDNASVLGEGVTELEEQLEIFKEKTGIPTVIVTVNNSDWESNYVSLERYAYDLYLQKFNDEDHWLIVYSEPSSWTYFNNWHCEAIQGDNTDWILTESKCDRFVETLDKNLLSSVSVTQAIADTFSDFNGYVMDNEPDIEIIIIMSLFSSLLIAVSVASIASCFKKYKPEELQEVYAQTESSIKPQKCAYCQCYYVIDDKTHTCPHCGAGKIEEKE